LFPKGELFINETLALLFGKIQNIVPSDQFKNGE